MINHSEVQKFIASTGLKSKTELKEYFSNQDPEILDMNLTYLVSKNRIRKSEYKSPEGTKTIYYIPKQ